MLEVPVGGGEVVAPPVVQPTAGEAAKPVGQAVILENNTQTGSAKEAGEQNGPEDSEKTVAENLNPDMVMDLADTIEATEDIIKEVPEAYVVTLRAITSKGELGDNLILTGQAVREEAKNAPAVREGVLTNEQRQRQIALGYDEEIGGLKIKLERTKKPKERQVLSERIKTLQEEKTKNTPEEFHGKNQLDDPAKKFGYNEYSKKLIEAHIKNGTPMLAVEQILETAVNDKGVRKEIISNLRGSKEFPDELVDAFEKNLKKLANKNKVKNALTIATLIGTFFLIIKMTKKEGAG